MCPAFWRKTNLLLLCFELRKGKDEGICLGHELVYVPQKCTKGQHKHRCTTAVFVKPFLKDDKDFKISVQWNVDCQFVMPEKQETRTPVAQHVWMKDSDLMRFLIFKVGKIYRKFPWIRFDSCWFLTIRDWCWI